MKSPYEKAKSLVDKICKGLQEKSGDRPEKYSKAVQLAYELVEEIIESDPKFPLLLCGNDWEKPLLDHTHTYIIPAKYWHEVRNQIEKLK